MQQSAKKKKEHFYILASRKINWWIIRDTHIYMGKSHRQRKTNDQLIRKVWSSWNYSRSDSIESPRYMYQKGTYIGYLIIKRCYYKNSNSTLKTKQRMQSKIVNSFNGKGSWVMEVTLVEKNSKTQYIYNAELSTK